MSKCLLIIFILICNISCTGKNTSSVIEKDSVKKYQNTIVVTYPNNQNSKAPGLMETKCIFLNPELQDHYNKMITHTNRDSINFVTDVNISNKKLLYDFNKGVLSIKILYYDNPGLFSKGIIESTADGVIHLKLGEKIEYGKSENMPLLYQMEYKIFIPEDYKLKCAYFVW